MSDVNHSTREHALLSASGASRWLNCTPSARLEEKFEESAASVYADEGTLAHEFAELNLRYANGEIAKKDLNIELKRLRKDKLYSLEIEEHVATYVGIVMEMLLTSKQVTKDAKLLIEERYDFSHIVEGGFGTGDATIIADKVMTITDLKYGKGVKVEANDNSQLKLYALGALKRFDLAFDIHTVRLVIVQPRLEHFDQYEISVEDLIIWANDIVKPRAADAYLGKGIKVAGSWCKWCKVKALCNTLAEENIRLAQHEFKDPHLLTDKELVAIFNQQPMLVDWVKAVGDYLLTQALKGTKYTGLKVVEGRSQRKWLDEQKAIEALTLARYNKKDFMVTELATITAIEKLVGKAAFGPLLNAYIVKPPGAPALVSESDKRPAMGIDQAIKDFS